MGEPVLSLDLPNPSSISTIATVTLQQSNISDVNDDEFSGVAYKVVVPTIWGIIIVIGAVGNSIVVFTMCKQGGRTMPRSATNCYIINVALADLAFLLLAIPFTTASYITPRWVFGEAVCKLNNYVINVSLLSTCLTLTAMTIDRYFAIVHPIRSLRTRTPKVAFIICVAIWLASMIVCIPYLKFSGLGQQPMVKSGLVVTVCWQQWPVDWFKVVTIIIVLITYVIPLAFIVISYTLILRNLWKHRVGQPQRENHHQGEPSLPCLTPGGDTITRRRHRVAKMVAVVVILFAVTWLPIHVFNLCFVLQDGFRKTKALYDFKIFAHTLSYTNSCVNPFVYTIMGEGFRKSFKESLAGCCKTSVKSQRLVTTALYSSHHRRATSTMETRFNGDTM